MTLPFKCGIVYSYNREDKYMRYFITLLTIMGGLYTFLMFGYNTANANEYNEAVIGNIIQNKVNGTNVDVSNIMEQELEKIAHKFALESIDILKQYLPVVLDGVLTELKMEADKEYKCKLLKDTSIQDDC